MTITQLIEKLQKLQNKNPDCEVRFQLYNFNEPQSKPALVGLDTVTLGQDSLGHACIFRLVTDGNPPK